MPPEFATALPSVALYYGENPPLAELKAFDVVVVDPDQPGSDPSAYRRRDSELFAYVSVGEVNPDRPYYRKMPPAWMLGENHEWGSKIVDQSGKDWPRFFADEVIAPLWKAGYRGFFLDTLDSYQRLSISAGGKVRQEAGLKAVIHEVKKRWPTARLILNRGFEIIPDVHDDIWMVAAESLFRGWDANKRSFVTISHEDRAWLEAQLHKIQKDYGLPILIIDYLPSRQRQLARDIAKKIHDEGFIPYVTTPDINTVGVGDVEVMPRKVLVIYNSHATDDVFSTEAVRFLGMPLAYLGLVPEYRSVDAPVPDYPLAGRYAGIVTWLSDDASGREKYAAWLLEQIDQGLPVAVFGHFGMGSDVAVLNQLGLAYIDTPPTRDLVLRQYDAMMNFEMPLRPNPFGLFPIFLHGEGKPLMTLAGTDGTQYTPAAITPWGGYLLYPYTVGELGGVDSSDRWYANPLSFLVAALKLDTSIPVPDFTTEMGRRLLMVHIDGDGFANKAERPGYPFAGRVLVDDVLKRYQIPTTVSLIEGEVGPAGLYPNDSPALEAVARDMYALPWVEIASHTFSHPFRWSEAQHGAAGGHKSLEADALPIKNYTFSLAREIGGSVAYINKNLSPPGKRVKVLLWSGDCVPTEEALAEVSKEGLLNMNGGDTIITHSRSSWTNIAGPGLGRGKYFQVFAPDQNENVYTNLWTGPFYGYQRVIETFQMTESPYRFKPIDIYYHPYAVTKAASLNALSKVYDWALQQPVNIVYLSDYIHKILDFNSFVVARTAEGYRLRGDGSLRTVRLPQQGAALNLSASNGVAGTSPGPKARYVSLVDGSADLAFSGSPARLPYIEFANARLVQFERTAGGISFGLHGYQPLSLTLNQARGCRLYEGATLVNPAGQENDQLHYELHENESLSLRLQCGA
jgi:uncharacterized protein (TIGR01370 family)